MVKAMPVYPSVAMSKQSNDSYQYESWFLGTNTTEPSPPGATTTMVPSSFLFQQLQESEFFSLYSPHHQSGIKPREFDLPPIAEPSLFVESAMEAKSSMTRSELQAALAAVAPRRAASQAVARPCDNIANKNLRR